MTPSGDTGPLTGGVSARARLSHPAYGSYPRCHHWRTAAGGPCTVHLEVDVPLSEHEQRLLEQIERALVDDDPKFASTVRTGDRRQKARRSMQLGAPGPATTSTAPVALL